MDFKKISYELIKNSAPLPLPKVPVKIPPGSGIRPKTLPLNKQAPLPSFKEPVSKITFGPAGEPIFPKEFFNESGKFKNPAEVKKALYEAKKQKIIEDTKSNKFLETSSKEISAIKASVDRKIALENFSNVAKKGFYIFVGLATACMIFSKSKPKSSSEVKQNIVETIDAPKLDPNNLVNMLTNYNNSVIDDKLKTEIETISKIISLLSTNINFDDMAQVKKYSNNLKILKDKMVNVSFKIHDDKLKAEMVKYIAVLDSLARMS